MNSISRTHEAATPLTAAKLGAVSLALAQAVTASAQTAPADDSVLLLDQVDVQADALRAGPMAKFTAPILDLPQTVSVIPSAVFSQQGAGTLSDVMRNTPGITFLAGEGGNASSADGDSFFLRGFDTSNSIFVDGVRDTGQFNRDVFNLEQVEVAKGPAGSDTGRGVASGYINLSTKVPTLERFTALGASIGSEDQKRATIDVNQPVNQSAAVRLNAMWQEGGVAGRNVVEENRWSVAPSISVGMGQPTRIHLSTQHTRQDNLPDYGLSRAAMPEPGGADSFSPLPPAVSQETFYGSIHDFDDVRSDSATARIEHVVSSNTRVSNQTRLNRSDRRAFLAAPTTYDAATGLLTRSRQGNQRENETLSNLTNLTTQLQTGAISHAISAGAEYSHEKQLSTTYTSVTLPGTPLNAPDITSVPPDPIASGASALGAIETLALYAFDTLRFGPSWQASGGFRWENYEGRFRSIAAGGAATRAEVDGSVLSWKGGLVFKPLPNGTVYAAYGTSFRPPGANFTFSTAATNVDNLSLDPQKSHNYELGTKWELLQRRLNLSLALFRTENTKVATTDAVSGAVVQQNDQIVDGLEVSASGNLTANWLVFGGFSLLDARFSAPASSANANVDGAQLQWTPKVSGNVWTTYRLPYRFIIGGGANYLGETQRQTTNTPAAAMPTTPDYWVFNLMGSWFVTDRVTLRLNINNVFDQFYVQSLNNNANRYNPGAPRSFQLTTDFRF